jgi:hypothetical protein
MPAVHDAALPPSIALTVLVHPSLRLRLVLVLAALVHAGAALFILANAAGFGAPWLLAGACCVAAALSTLAAVQPLKTRLIDISKAGAVRLTVQHKQPETARAVRLLPGSLLWANLLVLRLGGIDDAAVRVHTVLVFPDSVGGESFRALAVAMRATSGRGRVGNV